MNKINAISKGGGLYAIRFSPRRKQQTMRGKMILIFGVIVVILLLVFGEWFFGPSGDSGKGFPWSRRKK